MLCAATSGVPAADATSPGGVPAPASTLVAVLLLLRVPVLAVDPLALAALDDAVAAPAPEPDDREDVDVVPLASVEAGALLDERPPATEPVLVDPPAEAPAAVLSVEVDDDVPPQALASARANPSTGLTPRRSEKRNAQLAPCSTVSIA